MVPTSPMTENLDAYIERIKSLSVSYDNGDRTEECYRAKIANMIWEHGYLKAMDDMESAQMHTMLLLSPPMGNA